MQFFKIFNSKAYVTKFVLAVNEGQLRVIVSANFVVLEFQMPHTKFQGNRLSGSGEIF